MATEQLLLKTKLFTPPHLSSLVLRPRLTSRIKAGASRRLTLISAPAGFGKTTLIRAWSDEHEGNISLAWLSLDTDDNDPRRFLAYFLAAVDIAKSGLTANASSLLESSRTVSHKAILVALINDATLIQEQLVVVLDDYHFISALTIHEMLTYLLDNLPSQLHLVILTRSDPPLPLARLRSRGEMLELRAVDLSFTLEEVAEYMNRIMDLSLSPQNLQALESRTEGWITGLKLAALSMQGRQDLNAFVADFAGSHRYILDYLMEEVLARQPESIQQFLLRTSILERLNGSLCDEVLGIDEFRIVIDSGLGDSTYFLGSQQVLEYLERSNLFLIPLDDERHWYRWHHLFIELLYSRLQHAGPELIPALHLRASLWFERNGFLVEAARHAFSAEDYPRAADLFADYGQARWALSDGEFLQLAGKLPLELLQTRPSLGIYHAWFLIIISQYHDSEMLLRAMLQNISQSEETPETRGLRSFMDLLLIYIDEITGQKIHPQLPPRQVLDFVPEYHLGMRNSADVIYAYLLYLRSDFEAAVDLLLNTVQRDLIAGGTTAIPVCMTTIARMRILQGRLTEAASLCREQIKFVQERGTEHFYIAGNLNVVLGEVLRQWNDLEAAEKQIRSGLANNQRWNVPLVQVVCYTTLARLQYSQGNLEQAAASLEKLEAMIQGKTISIIYRKELEALRVRLWLAQGDIGAARAWADKLPRHEPLAFHRELDYLTLARIYLAQEQPQLALELLEQLALLADVEGRNGRLIEIRVLEAIALLGLKHTPQALHKVEAGLALGEPEGYVRVFLDEGFVMQALLEAYLRQRAPAHAAYAQSLLSAFPTRKHPPSAEGALVEPLTPRELEVLELISSGDSNHTIARKLVITISAVKKHTGNIYGKLGVKSRTQAVARARQLRLLPLDD